MGKLETNRTAIPHVEGVLRNELARGDKALSGVAPVLAHLIAGSGFSLVSEAVVARLRGMLADIARQVLGAIAGLAAPADDEVDTFADYLATDSAILSHLYATAMEGQFTDRLDVRQSVDPVLGSMLQELIGSEQAATAELAMATMAAQSRFVQSQRRMELPISELPAELFDLVLRRSVSHLGEQGIAASPNAVQILKRKYDESATRVSLLGRLVTGLGGAARAALDLENSGLALFASALAILTKQPRELAILACHEQQGARLALCLRAAGLDEDQIERQFALIEPAERLPKGLADISPDRAQSILGHSTARNVG